MPLRLVAAISPALWADHEGRTHFRSWMRDVKRNERCEAGDLLACWAEERARVAESRLDAAGGFAAIRYVLDQARESGNSRELVSRLRSANACKTCAVGMGGDRGGMVNEVWPLPGGVQEVGTSAGR